MAMVEDNNGRNGIAVPGPATEGSEAYRPFGETVAFLSSPASATCVLPN
jgi:hypothetical protein